MVQWYEILVRYYLVQYVVRILVRGTDFWYEIFWYGTFSDVLFPSGVGFLFLDFRFLFFSCVYRFPLSDFRIIFSFQSLSSLVPKRPGFSLIFSLIEFYFFGVLMTFHDLTNHNQFDFSSKAPVGIATVFLLKKSNFQPLRPIIFLKRIFQIKNRNEKSS